MIDAITTPKTSTGRVLMPYQERWRADDSDLKIWEKSRRIGATFTEANDVAFSRLSGRRNEDYWFSSADESAAYEFADYVRYWMGVAGQVAAGVDREDVEDDGPTGKATAFVVKFPNGKRMTAMTSNPRRFRSKGGDVGLDEFAYHDSPAAMYEAAEPCTMWGGRLRILSTHNGEGSEFHRFCEMGQRFIAGAAHRDDIPWSVHRVTLPEAVEQGLVEMINATRGTAYTREQFLADRRKRCRSEDHWNQEYLAIPSVDTTAWLTYDLIRGCESDQAGQPDLTGSGQLYIGMDIGETQDRTCICVLERVGDILWIRELVVTQGEPLRVQEEALLSRLRNAKTVRACIDATGVGAQIAQAAEAMGKGEGLKFSLPVKDMLASPLRGLFEDRKVRVPADAEVREDLHAVRMQRTAGGHPRYDAERTAAGHADRFWSLALAVHAASQVNTFGITVF